MLEKLNYWLNRLKERMDLDGAGTLAIADVQRAILKALAKASDRTLKAKACPAGLVVFLSNEAREVLRLHEEVAKEEIQESFLELMTREHWIVPPGGPQIRYTVDPRLKRTEVRTVSLSGDRTSFAGEGDVTNLRIRADIAWLENPTTGKKWELPREGAVVLGNELSGADLKVGGPAVSRAHISVRANRGTAGRAPSVFIEDLESLNGTWVNDVRLEPHRPVEVHPGDRIKVANVELLSGSSSAEPGKHT